MRWEICFNLSILRMISYSLDLHGQRQRAESTAVMPASHHHHHRHQPHQQIDQQQGQEQGPAAKACKASQGPEAAGRLRQQRALPDEEGVLWYLAYVLYAPLYLAGPIITYRDFAWQLRQGAACNMHTVRRLPLPFVWGGF